MAKIRKLDTHTTNLIAAGEVIERVSSVVKELVENSIDAEAKNIRIYLQDSGINEIRVIDDGIGMEDDDARMCILPHATSKINDENDLFSINTLGFRGEALASIVAVSDFRLITNPRTTKAIMFSVKGGVVKSIAMVAHPPGTEIIVKNLFYNTPARLQNLQTPTNELGYVTDYICRMAIARPDISFLLVNNEKEIVRTYGNNNLLEVFSNIYGNDIAKEMIELFGSDSLYHIEGLISAPVVSRSSKNYITIIVNGRVIRNNNLINAIIKGYDTKLMVGKYPIAVINITLDPALVDVNVHPAKTEVRFSNEEKLCELIYNQVKYYLNKTDLTVEINIPEEPKYFEYQDEIIENDDLQEEQVELDEEYEQVDEEYEQIDDTTEEDSIFEEPQQEELFTIDEDKSFVYNKTNDIQKEVIPEEPLEEVVDETFHQQQYNLANNSINEEIQDVDNPKNKIGHLNYIGQLFGTYIIAQDEGVFYLIDQHAAAERVNYEKIIKELSNDNSPTYDLLVPINLQFSPSDAIKIEAAIEEINSLGIKLEDFGGGSFIVRTIPLWIFRGKEREFTEEIITQIINKQKTTKVEFLNSVAKSLACKKSIKANEYHSTLEIQYLLERLAVTENPYTCPHGRPIIIKFTQYEIEKWFKRIV